MFRRNLDFFALMVVLLGMSAARHVPPPPPAVPSAVIRLQDATVHARCPLESILSHLALR